MPAIILFKEGSTNVPANQLLPLQKYSTLKDQHFLKEVWFTHFHSVIVSHFNSGQCRSSSEHAVSLYYMLKYGSRIYFILLSIPNCEPEHQHKIQNSFLLLSSPLPGLSLPAILATSRTHCVHLGQTLCYQ